MVKNALIAVKANKNNVLTATFVYVSGWSLIIVYELA
jgi:hypothetical protein